MSDYPEHTPCGLTIREMPEEQKPREKALTHGVGSLSDAELMAIVFATGIRGKSVLRMSEEIIDGFDGHISRLAALDVKELCKRFKGIGPAKALTLLAGVELGVRAAKDDARLAAAEKPLTSPETIWNLMKDELQGLEHEEFWVLFLKQSGHLIKKEQIGRGGLSATLADVRLILREALLCLASSIILVHNHPSGNLRPSEQDKILTRKLKEAAKFHEIRVFDHIIFTDKDFFSFHNEGLMD